MARPAMRQGKRASMSSVYLRRAHAGIGLLGPCGASSTGAMEPRLSWLGSRLASTVLPASRRRAESTLAGVDDAPAPIEGEEGVAGAQMATAGVCRLASRPVVVMAVTERYQGQILIDWPRP